MEERRQNTLRKELTEIQLREKEISLEENPNLEEEHTNDNFEEPADEEIKEIQSVAKRAYAVTNCKGFARVDIFVISSSVKSQGIIWSVVSSKYFAS